MKFYVRMLGGVAGGLLLISFQASRVEAANAYPVFTDINIGPQSFGASASSFGGVFVPNDTATLNGNQVLRINQNGDLDCCHGAVVEVSISNDENGVTETAPPGHPLTPGGPPDPANNNLDPNNTVAANSVFATIGNASGKLENGNVIRFSAWFRSDPANPITLDPQVQPVMKIEYWKQALSDFQDATGEKVKPAHGDRVFDQDQQGNALDIADLPHWIDINGDGVVLDGAATVGNGRVTQITTTEWRRAEVLHTVNSADWFGIGAESFGANNLGAIESIKAVMFMGDFASTNLTGDGPDGGNLLIDNLLVEVFKDAAAVSPNTNPNPTLSEGLPGDYNGNGRVDAADYVVWRNGGPLQNEGASIGVINDLDYTFWRERFGNSSGPVQARVTWEAYRNRARVDWPCWRRSWSGVCRAGGG